MDDIVSKRKLVKDAYDNSPAWVAKVDAMTDQQVLAVYFRLKKTNRI